MLENAKLVSISPPPVADANGGLSASSPVSIADRILLDEPSSAQRIALLNRSIDFSAVAYTPLPLTGGVVPIEGGTIVVRLDGAAEDASYRIAKVYARVLGDLDHYEILVKGR